MTNPTPKADKKQATQADKDRASQSSAPLSLQNPTSKTRSRRSKADPSAHKRVTDHYFRTFEAVRGSKPPFDGADAKAVARLLKKLNGDADRACRTITDGFASWKGGTLSILAIAKDPASCIGAAPQKTNGRRTDPPAAQNNGKQVHQQANGRW